MSEYYRFLADQIVDAVHSLPVRSLCDYGCYSGELLLELEKRLPETEFFTGIDFFEAYKIETKQPDGGRKIQYVDRTSDDYKKLMKSPRFDLIISTAALHHYRSPVNELQTIAQMLRSGGYLYVMDFDFQARNNAEITKNVISFFEELLAATRGKFHHHHYSLEQAKDLFRGVDLNIVNARSIDFQESAEDIENDVKETRQRIQRKIDGLKNASEIYQEIFSVIFDLELNLVDKYGIDYSSMFQILAQKP